MSSGDYYWRLFIVGFKIMNFNTWVSPIISVLCNFNLALTAKLNYCNIADFNTVYSVNNSLVAYLTHFSDQFYFCLRMKRWYRLKVY